MSLEEGEVQRDGAALGYTVLGEGEPLLLLPGGPGLSAAYMQPVAEALHGQCRCILPQPRGTGEAGADDLQISLDSYVSDLESLREVLGIAAWSVLGHSFGGMWAMAYAAAFPERIQRLVLASPGGMDLTFFSYFVDNILTRLTSWERAAFTYWSDPSRVAADPDHARREQVAAICPGYFWDRGPVPAFADGLEQWFSPQVERLVLQSMTDSHYDVRDAMRSFTAPTLVVQGRQDPLGDGLAVELASVVPNATLTFVNRAGHFSWLEQPDPVFAPIRAFLAS